MQLFKNLKFTTKLILSFTFLFLILIGAAIYLISKISGDILANQALHTASEKVSIHKLQLESFFDSLKAEVVYLSNLSELDDLIHARKGEENYEKMRNAVASTFAQLMQAKQVYMQLRYIDEEGNEIVRVDFNGKTTKIIPRRMLQNKKDRYYYTETIKLPEGSFYISPMDLNREGFPPKIEIPYKPVIRYGVPIYDNHNNRKGIVIANILGNSFLKTLQEKRYGNTGEDAEIFLLDREGFYLFNQDKDKEWGSPQDLDTWETLSKYFPEIYSQILSGKSAALFHRSNVISYSPLFPDKHNRQNFWIIMSIIPKKLAFAQVSYLKKTILTVSLIIVGFSIILIYFLSHFITRPIKELSDMTQKLSEANPDMWVNIQSKDEIGKFAVLFNDMSSRLEDLYFNLNEKIKIATLELTKSMDELHKQSYILQRKNNELSNMAQLSRIMVQELKLDALIERTFTVILDFFNLKAGAVFIYNKDENMLHIRKAVGLSEEILRKVDDQKIQPEDTGVAGTCAYRKETIIIDDLKTHPLSQYVVEDIKREGLQFLVSIPLLSYDQIVGVLSIITTERRQFDEEDLKALTIISNSFCMAIKNSIIYEEEIAKVQRLKELDILKDDFLNTISHDLSTPITTIMGYTNILKRKEVGFLNERQESYANSIINSCYYLSFLVDNLLSCVKIEAGRVARKRDNFSLSELIEESYDLFKPQIEKKNIGVAINFQEELYIEGDRGELKRLIANLISNAVKFTPPGGNIRLDMSTEGDLINISVIDNGKGIPKEEIPKLFNKFGKIGDETGMGLGLYISKRIVEAHGGNISIESEPSKGTKVAFTLKRKP